jgi:predicted dehydrogenase
MRTAVSVGIVGLGRSGAALAASFASLPQADVRWLCDESPQVRLRERRAYPHARLTATIDDLLADEAVDAVVIATPAATHSALACRALDAEKHVFVQRPLALRAEDAEELVRLAERRGRRLAVAEPLLFHPAVRELKRLVDLGRLGEIFYLSSRRHAFDAAASGESALWTLGASEIALILHLIGDEPVAVSAEGDSYVQPATPDVLGAYLRFATGISAYLHLSSLDPHAVHAVTVVGSKRVALFDPLEPERKLTIYEKHVDSHVHLGSIVSPVVPQEDPRRLQCADFLAGLSSPGGPLDGTERAAAVVSTLETLERSLTTDRPHSALPQASRVVRLAPAPDAEAAASRPIRGDGQPSYGQGR